MRNLFRGKVICILFMMLVSISGAKNSGATILTASELLELREAGINAEALGKKKKFERLLKAFRKKYGESSRIKLSSCIVDFAYDQMSTAEYFSRVYCKEGEKYVQQKIFIIYPEITESAEAMLNERRYAHVTFRLNKLIHREGIRIHIDATYIIADLRSVEVSSVSDDDIESTPSR